MDDQAGPNTAVRAAGADPDGYRVLARKYRPRDFSDLIGQAPMVRTLTNAFETGRIAQAWMLTGVRGVGKTTTARILARALNYQSETVDQPTVELSELGVHCQAIMDGRHVDVIEMDAASHTGIDDIRDIIEQVRYRPVAARYKVYIIDEVHMLSTQAFNGLLKTLEEPPSHVKFIFATTEIRKVPITVLSRCQRFDLRRIDTAVLAEHFSAIARQEAVEVDSESLAMIARAAEGSVRDGLSLLDQAIAHGGGSVDADTVRTMLGLADRSRVVDLFDRLMAGDVAATLAQYREQYDAGASPLVVLTDLADLTHLVTRLKFVPEASDASLTEIERQRGAEFATTLSTSVLSRTWQMLLKGISETEAATRQSAAAEMTLIRIAHAAGLPSPEEAAKLIADGRAGAAADAPPAASAPPAPQPGVSARRAVGSDLHHAPQEMSPATAADSLPRAAPHMHLAHSAEPAQDTSPAPGAAPHAETVPIRSLDDLVALAEQHRDIAIKVQIRTMVRLVRIEPGRIEINLTEDASPTLPGELIKKLRDWTGVKWTVALSREAGAPTLAEGEAARRDALVSDARQDVDVAAILSQFPGARITDVRIFDTEENLSADLVSETDEGDILPAADGEPDDML
ncbi:DNA polymerase III subunit gamma/tau [Pseudohoeflea coraliihabitans]|uniref:DNA polymerase III subunit gamma/tau n=1 Tax=Pseudohoeflea coraliihabitans TaxID=2860393 RepID=A0ABS6WP82_9HYPH|nr:DNA polymerase III subunit gamma/tau [Pseudohoeflea sp. DP4N28-3]MBW3097763.1 DNA polymerase III subunit gamma/tau [Pseudohoeflea sp. DP4N28-3]